MSERFKEHAWKACVGETQPWVQIPPSPPFALAAAGLKVQPYWPALFLKAIQGRSIDSLLTSGSSGSSAPAQAAQADAPKAAAPAKKEEEKVEEAESIGGLFD